MKNIANNLNFSENLKAMHIAWQLMEKDASEPSTTDLDEDDWTALSEIFPGLIRWFLSISLSIIVFFLRFPKTATFF